jgi:acyl dehydratase
MAIRSAAVGTSTDPARREVSTRLTQAYAAGLADCNPRYLDDAGELGVIAPPAFCVSVEWPVFLALTEMEVLGASREDRLRGVHALQDSTFRRPIRSGDVLVTTAKIIEVRATRAGAFVLVRLDTLEERSVECAVTSYYGSIFRDVAVDSLDVCAEAPPAFPEVAPARFTEKVEILVQRQAAHVYTECARIWNPIHTERRVALAAGLPDIILHGTATWALAAREIVDRFAAGDPLRLRRLAGQFRAQVVPGSPIVFEAGCAGDRVDFVVRNEKGEPAIASGRALIDDEEQPSRSLGQRELHGPGRNRA